MDDGDAVALGQQDLEPVRERGPLDGREDDLRRRPDRRHGLPVDIGRRGLERRVGMDLEDVDAVGEPVVGALLEGICRGVFDVLEGLLVGVGRAAVDHARGQDVGLAAEAADPLDALDEAGPGLDLDPLELGRGRAVLEELGQLLVDGLLDLGQLDAGLGVGLDGELPGDLAGVDVAVDRAGDLVVVDQALVEAGGLAVGQDGAHQIELVGALGAPAGDVPELVDAGLGDAVLDGLAVGPGHLGDPGGGPGDGRRGRDVAEVLLRPSRGPSWRRCRRRWR